MPVSVADAIRDASSEWLLEAAARRIGKRRLKWPLLPSSSQIINGRGLAFAEALFDQVTPGASSVEQLADYVELSAWGHVLDGWRYLSQAASSLLHADRQKALHLAYYAELRGALGILASSGIAVLNKKHFAITSTGELRWFGGPTHVKAWEAISAWVSQPTNVAAVIEALGLNTMAGVQWLELCRATSGLTDIASHWLTTWSFDLTQLYDDKKARDEATYRPELSGQAFTPLLRKDLELVQNASRGCLHIESDGSTPSQTALVADLCRASADFRFTGTDEAREGRFGREAVRWLVNWQRLTQKDALALVEYIRLSRDNPAGKVLRLTDTHNHDARAVFSRAYFLQQLASFLLLKHRQAFELRAPGGHLDWPDTILKQFGLQSQLWAANGVPYDLRTIEADTEEANEQLVGWKEGKDWCSFTLWQDKAAALAELCRFERHFVVMASI